MVWKVCGSISNDDDGKNKPPEYSPYQHKKGKENGLNFHANNIFVSHEKKNSTIMYENFIYIHLLTLENLGWMEKGEILRKIYISFVIKAKSQWLK